ncbi:hypothetical protein HanPI659440_Chr09g0352241 [Helianthus annuus]|nr:hypothetical protein HanPI659440_Chr09g0352241 [Helianthus annuus]
MRSNGLKIRVLELINGNLMLLPSTHEEQMLLFNFEKSTEQDDFKDCKGARPGWPRRWCHKVEVTTAKVAGKEVVPGPSTRG